MNTINKDFAQWMEDNSFGTRGTDIFIGAVPKEIAGKRAFWIVSGGGTPVIRANTGEKGKAYLITVFLRDIDSESVDETLQLLEETINSKNCKSLNNYETIEMEASGFASDQDLDQEDRTIGSVEVTLTVYQSS